MRGSVHCLHSKEVVTQGGSLSMIAYYVGILPLIRELRVAHPHTTQLWYADESGTGSKLEALQEHIQYLMARVPPWGYLLEPTNSILVI